MPGTALRLAGLSVVLVLSAGCCRGCPSCLLGTQGAGTPKPRMNVNHVFYFCYPEGTYVFPIRRVAILLVVSDFVKVVFIQLPHKARKVAVLEVLR
jgi:hypothetical protein